jgi:hypothetical protein
MSTRCARVHVHVHVHVHGHAHVQARESYLTYPPTLCTAGIIKNMWQSLKMRTMFHRDQKIRDCYVAFILHNLKLEARDTFDWGYAEPDEESPVLAADTDVEGKLNGDIFRNNLINQMWIDRTERKAAAAQVA